MLVIRKDQFDEMQRQRVANFEEVALSHIRRCFPELSRRLPESGIRQLIRFGLNRAQRWRITQARELVKFIDIMIIISPTFDDDTRLPWAQTILKSTDTPAEVRLDALHRAAIQFLERIAAGDSPSVVVRTP